MLERWQKLCDRLYHLAYLGEELESFGGPGNGQQWIYREIAREAAAVTEIANAYTDESDLARAYYGQGSAAHPCDSPRPRAGDEQ